MFENTTLNDLRNILTGSVVRHDNRACLISNIVADEVKPVIAYYLDNGSEFFSHWNDPAWNFEPVPLGFINSDNSQDTLFCYRVPNRQYQVGLSGNNVQVQELRTSSGSDLMRRRAMDAASRIRNAISGSKKFIALSKCISNNYPTLDQVFEELDTGKKNSIGVSRDFALDANYCLFFRTEMVGVLNEDAKPTFSRGKSYLNKFWEERNERR